MRLDNFFPMFLVAIFIFQPIRYAAMSDAKKLSNSTCQQNGSLLPLSPNQNGENQEDEENFEVIANNVCTAGYFLDKIIPEDYPHEITKEVKHINETIERLNRMYNFTNTMIEKLKPFIRESISRMFDYLLESELDPQCMGAFFRVLRAINQRKLWALSFVDASGSFFTGGFQQGMFVSLGEFDECMEIHSDPLENANIIHGQYCLLKPIVPIPEKIKRGEAIVKSKIRMVNRFLNNEYVETYLGLYKFIKRTFLRIGICLPHQCRWDSLENAINRIMVRKTGLSVKIGPECVKSIDQATYDFHQLMALTIFGTIMALILASTIYELFNRSLACPKEPQQLRKNSVARPMFCQQQPRTIQLLTSFSLIRNSALLFGKDNPGRFAQLDTTRLLLTIFFFITNAYYYTLIFAPMVIKRFYVQGPLQFMSERKYFFIRMYYLMDCFIVFSAIAMSFSFNNKTIFSYAWFLVKNYLALILPIMVSIGIIYVAPLLGSGPLWHLFEQTMSQPCKYNLWSTVLLFNNFDENIEEICNAPTVFVSMLFQLKVIASLILLISSTMPSKRKGTYFFLLVLVVASFIQLVPRFVFDKKIFFEYKKMNSFSEIKNSIMFFFFSPFNHFNTVSLGLLVGHLISIERVLSWRSNAALGSFTFLAFISSFIYIEKLNLFKTSLSLFEVVCIVSVGRLCCTSLFAWIVYSSIQGHFIMVNRFLCSIFFRPLSRLSYGFYITSIIVTCYRLFSIRQTITMDAQTMFRAIVSDAVISFCLAYIIHIMVSQPMRNLMSLYFSSKAKQTTDKNKNRVQSIFFDQKCFDVVTD